MKLVQDSTELPPWKNGFHPWQLETGKYLTQFLHKHASVDEETAPLMAEMILRVVLGVFRPDMFEPADPEHLKAALRGILVNLES